VSGPAHDAAAPLPCGGSAHLTVLVSEVDRLAALLRDRIDASDPSTVAARRRAEDATTAAATLRLDGALLATADGGAERAGTWLDALGGAAAAADTAGETGPTIDDAELARLAELERRGAEAGIKADDLSEAFGRTMADASGLGTALAVLHGRMTHGLVADDRVGQLRRGPRVVHDASVGRVLYFPTDPALLPDAWDALLRRTTSSVGGSTDTTAPVRPAAVRAALLQLELLRHQPFDAANGRLARAAGRLALLADGLLPAGLGAPDAILAGDLLGYHEEIAASMRRRDATAWAERILEAHGQALRDAITALHDADGGDGAPRPPIELTSTFTLGEVCTALEVDTATAREHCSAWVVAGAAQRVIGSGGLRLVRPAAQPGTV